MFSVLSVALWLALAGQAVDIPLTTAKDFYRQGMSLMRAGKYEDALPFFREAADKQPEYPDAYYGRGLAYNALRLYAKACVDFSKAIELKADYAEAYTAGGRACLSLAPGSEKCLPDLNQALKLNSKFTDGYIVRALFYSQRGDLQRARADLDLALKLQPHNAEALYGRASVLLKLRNKPAAIDDLKRVVEFGHPALADRARRTLQELGVR